MSGLAEVMGGASKLEPLTLAILFLGLTGLAVIRAGRDRDQHDKGRAEEMSADAWSKMPCTWQVDLLGAD